MLSNKKYTMKMYTEYLDDCDFEKEYNLLDWFSSDKLEDLFIALRDKVTNLMCVEKVGNYQNENGIIFGDEIKVATFWWDPDGEWCDDVLITLKRNY